LKHVINNSAFTNWQTQFADYTFSVEVLVGLR
jgi:hypothetical protein